MFEFLEAAAGLREETTNLEQRTQVGILCPQCHRKQFMEIEVDNLLLKSPVAREIQGHLEAWVASRCPDHLNIIAEMSKN